MSISPTKRKRLWEISDKCCAYCHQSLKFETMTVDHVVPKSAFKEGSESFYDDESNLCVACKTCNVAKGNMSVKEFRKAVNVRNSELLKLESDRRSAIAQLNELSKQIDGKRFDYIHHLRKVVM